MECLVTAGPTFEPLDEVRRLTNFSTGRLGTELANFLSARGHRVTLLIGEQATWRGERLAETVETFTTNTDLSDRLAARSGGTLDALFHAAAVGDFSFGRVWLQSPQGTRSEIQSAKISTREGTLLAELLPTQKIINRLRDWFPNSRLVGWKFEVEGDQLSSIRRAGEQLIEARTDACVVNGRAYGGGFGLVRRAHPPVHLSDVAALFPALESLVREIPAPR